MRYKIARFFRSSLDRGYGAIDFLIFIVCALILVWVVKTVFAR